MAIRQVVLVIAVFFLFPPVTKTNEIIYKVCLMHFARSAIRTVTLFAISMFSNTTLALESDAPVLDSISLDRATVNVGAAPQTITVTVAASDASGINWAAGTSMPGGTMLWLRGPGDQSRFIPGTNENPGVFEVIFDVTDASGSWAVVKLFLTDSVGNTGEYKSSALAELGFPLAFEVVGGSESNKPILESISADKNTVNVGAAPQTITVTVAASDASGINWAAGTSMPGGTMLWLRGPGDQSRFIPGTNENPGVFEVIFDVTDASGSWAVVKLFLTDSVGNTGEYKSSALAELGFPLAFEVFSDTDGDGINNENDLDDDNDGIADNVDAFPLDATESLDTDSDGTGNNADPDDDGDGVYDENDWYPLDAMLWSMTIEDALSGIADANLKSCVAEVTSSMQQVSEVTSLDCSGRGIGALNGLSGFATLTGLFLYDNQITDVSPLSGLTNLDYLKLDLNQISDVSGLSGLTNLTVLILNDNQITDVSPLSGLTNLTELYLQTNQITTAPYLRSSLLK